MKAAVGMTWPQSLTKALIVAAIFFGCLTTRAEHVGGDYVNHFIAYFSGGEENVKEVVSFLQKRSADVISTIDSDTYGFLVHFTHGVIHPRSKRSSEAHTAIVEISRHPHIRSIEQQRELIRDKRDYYSHDQIAKAKKLVEQYLKEVQSANEQSPAAPAVAPTAARNIQHDKQRELNEPLYYANKDVYKRYPVEAYYSHTHFLDHRDYDPKEDRAINLNDEHWKDQWYLNNIGQAGGPRGLDINVVPAWQQGFSGRGVSVCVLDDGIEHTHDDLKDNYWDKISADFNSKTDSDPMPNPKDLDENSHGTRCAGEIAASANNTFCGVGVAFNARIGGVRILDGTVTDSLEAAALLFNNHLIDIYSASWGPRDDGKTMETPGKHCMAALEQGVDKGRNGKGSIFVWATGNGGYNGDDCAADGYVSSPYTLSIGSINNYAESTYFMEWCPSTLAVIYTGGFHTRKDAQSNDELTHPILKIVTTDVRNKCTLNFQGTSSAAPLAAGVMALALEANPSLTWRDLQHIVVLTSKVPNTVEKGWTINGAGLHINDKFGYGALDAAQMVQLAQTWSNVGPQHSCLVQSATQSNRSSTFSKSLKVTMQTDGCQKSADNRVDRLEHVQMYVRLDTARRGNIRLTLTSPAGTRSEMLSSRRNDDSSDGIDFMFMTVRCWNEIPRGTWTLVVEDTGSAKEAKTTLHSWSLTLLGTAHSTTTRDASSVSSEKAYEPNKKTLTQLMHRESEAAVNVNIRKGSEVDVIKSFASNGGTQSVVDEANNGRLTSPPSPTTADLHLELDAEIARIVAGMSSAELKALLSRFREKVAAAQSIRNQRKDEELYRKLEEFLTTN